MNDPVLIKTMWPTDCSHAGRAAEGGSTGGAGPAHLAGSGKEGVWRSRDHSGSLKKTQ